MEGRILFRLYVSVSLAPYVLCALFDRAVRCALARNAEVSNAKAAQIPQARLENYR